MSDWLRYVLFLSFKENLTFHAVSSIFTITPLVFSNSVQVLRFVHKTIAKKPGSWKLRFSPIFHSIVFRACLPSFKNLIEFYTFVHTSLMKALHSMGRHQEVLDDMKYFPSIFTMLFITHFWNSTPMNIQPQLKRYLLQRWGQNDRLFNSTTFVLIVLHASPVPFSRWKLDFSMSLCWPPHPTSHAHFKEQIQEAHEKAEFEVCITKLSTVLFFHFP